MVFFFFFCLVEGECEFLVFMVFCDFRKEKNIVLVLFSLTCLQFQLKSEFVCLLTLFLFFFNIFGC